MRFAWPALLITLFIASCTGNKDKVAEQATDTTVVVDAFDAARPAARYEWMCLSDSNVWVPVSGPVEEVLSQSRICFLKAEYDRSADKLLHAAELLNKASIDDPVKERAMKAVAGDIVKLAEKTKTNKTTLPELDSEIRKICDMSMKNCWFEVHEDMWIKDDEVERYLKDAYNNYQSENKPAAGREVRKASRIVQAEVRKNCDGSQEQVLTDVANQLEKLASDLETGKDVTDVTIKSRLFVTFNSLAKSHSTNTINAWHAGSKASAGKELQAAAKYTSLSAKWLEKKLTVREQNTIDACTKLGVELEKNVPHSTQEVETFIAELGIILENLSL